MRWMVSSGFCVSTVTLQHLLQVMAALTEVLSSCIDFLSPNIARPLLEKSMKRVIQTVENLTADDFRDKVVYLPHF